MTNTIVYALDFDGVICDSALETGTAGWKAALHLWPEMSTHQPSALLEQFRQARPILETGYEAILIVRLLFLGKSPANIVANFHVQKQAVIDSAGQDINALKKLFSAIRDNWIQEAPTEWAQLNPLFPGVAAKLDALSQQGSWYILTTKQERFIKQILSAQHIDLPEQRIYGMDCQLSKEDMLLEVRRQHPGQPMIFVEDRLPALLAAKNDPRLPDITLQLVDWGYNLPEDHVAARKAGVNVIDFDNFLKP